MRRLGSELYRLCPVYKAKFSNEIQSTTETKIFMLIIMAKLIITLIKSEFRVNS